MFAGWGPAVSTEGAVGAHYAVARYQDGYGVLPDGVAYGARCCGSLYALCDPAICSSASARNRQQGLPYGELKRCGAEMQDEVGTRAVDGVEGSGVVVGGLLYEAGAGIERVQMADGFGWRVDENEGAHAASG